MEFINLLKKKDLYLIMHDNIKRRDLNFCELLSYRPQYIKLAENLNQTLKTFDMSKVPAVR